jgi:hypothetical protein
LRGFGDAGYLQVIRECLIGDIVCWIAYHFVLWWHYFSVY